MARYLSDTWSLVRNLWNNLPIQLKNITEIKDFKKQVRQHLFQTIVQNETNDIVFYYISSICFCIFAFPMQEIIKISMSNIISLLNTIIFLSHFVRDTDL